MKLTLPQQDVYFEQLLYNEEPIYNIGAKAVIEGEINNIQFSNAYSQLIKQHDSYRTIFYTEQESVLSKVIESFNDELEILDFSKFNNSEEKANKFIKEEFIKPIEITSGSFLFKFILIKVSNQLHYLFMVCHHIITDGWGTSLMFQRLVKNYNELLEFGEVNSTYPYLYSAFIEDDTSYRISENYNFDKMYWVEKFKILPENLFDKLNTDIHLNKSSRKSLIIKRSTYNELNSLAKEYKSSTFHILLALIYTYFGRKHQKNDFAIGLPVLNRSKSIFKKTVGLFMGVAPLRLELNFEDTIQQIIATIKNQLRQDYRHQRYPLGKLVQELQAFHEKDKLFNITLSYEKQDYADHFGDTKTTVIPLTHQSERVALGIYIREFDEKDDVNIDFDYNLNYFDEYSISKTIRHFEILMNNVLKAPNTKLKDLNFLTSEEENQLLTIFNNTAVEYSKDKTLLYFFNKKVKEQPNNTALIDRNEKFSYLKLDALSDQIAQYVLKYSQGKNTTNIGLLLERSVTTVAIMIGILKTGKSFIPLDPSFPKERLKHIIDHSAIEILISDQELSKFSEVTTIKVDDLLNAIQKLKGKISVSVKSTDTAYIIYTSGSTGKPKGVEIEHQALLNFLLSMQREPGIQNTDILLAVTTYSFDISILEFFAPLISGASIYIVSDEILKDPVSTIQIIRQVNPTIIQATPSFYQLLFNAGWEGNKSLKILCGGDLLSNALLDLLIKSCGQLWNMYGPTETTIWSSVKQVAADTEAANIGSPIGNTQFYILDSFKRLKPIGSAGSLYIGGDGLAKGYYKDSELTQQKFISNPFKEGTLLYNTNDVGLWNEKGEIVFLGRDDNQVKIRGYRIELAEIETKLNYLPEIKRAILVAKKHKNQDSFLVAYIIKANENFNEEDCILALEKDLPKYMIPYTFIEVEDFPLTPNKKVDRKMLSQLEINKTVIQEEFQHPQTKLQEKLISYWKEVLHYKGEISTKDNYFSLGGHSLNAVKLVHLIKKELNYAIPLKVLFDFPTVLSLANYLSTMAHMGTQNIPITIMKDYYRITPSQYEIWLASQNKDKSIANNMVAAFHVKGKIDTNRINKTVNRLIIENEILRTNFLEIEGYVYQKINEIENLNFNISLEQSDLIKVEDQINKFINREFDLEHGYLIKMRLLQLSSSEFVLVFCAHHIIMDGWSLEILINDFSRYYNSNTVAITVKDNCIQFKDYTEWFNSSIETKEDTSFWEYYLEGYRIKDSFVPDHVVDKEEHNGSHLSFELTEEETLVLKSFIRQQNATMHNFLIAALNVLIFKFSGQNDIILGTVNTGRNRIELTNMIGMFVKTLPLRIKILKGINFNALLKVVQDGILNIDSKQDIPFDRKDKLHYDVLAVFQNPDFTYQESIRLEGAELSLYPINVAYSKFPLQFNFFETNDILSAVLSYNNNIYDEESIKLIVLKYKKLINKIISSPTTQIVDLDIALDFEKQKTVDINFNF